MVTDNLKYDTIINRPPHEVHAAGYITIQRVLTRPHGTITSAQAIPVRVDSGNFPDTLRRWGRLRPNNSAENCDLIS